MTDHPNLASALVAALADLCVVKKGRTADMKTYKYDYAALEDCVEDTRPVLASHGVVALTPLTHHGDGPAVEVVLMHTSGDEKTFGPFPFAAGRDAQATGSMVTYMRRYALLAALGMAAGDDDDGAAASPRDNTASNGRSGATVTTDDDLVTQARAWMDASPDNKKTFTTTFQTNQPAKAIAQGRADEVRELITAGGVNASPPGEGEAGADDATGASPASPAPTKKQKYEDEEPF